MQPERKANLLRRLVKLDQSKKAVATCAVYSATNDADRKKAIVTRSKLFSYGTSCFMRLFDDETAPSVNRQSR